MNSPTDKPIRLSVKVTAVVLAVVVSLAAVEFILRIDWRPNSEPALKHDWTLYSSEELRRDLPRFTERQGRDCIQVRSGLNWDPRFGFASKKLDKDCAKRLFAAHEKSVVLLGGSVMQNNEAPNYLTSIDTYAFGKDKRYASLNLAESGARHSNMLARFIHEIIELKPDYVVFLDGYNEFNSIRYGGEPEDDFYWAAGAKTAISRPVRYLLYKLYNHVRILEVVSNYFGFGNPARLVRDDVTPEEIERAAEYYLKTRAYTAVLCQAYKIKCLFLIQPIKSRDSPNPMVAEKIYEAGYARILSRAGTDVQDLSNFLVGRSYVFIDAAHVDKRGSKWLGEYIYDAVQKAAAKD
jgi:hypothetical protein